MAKLQREKKKEAIVNNKIWNKIIKEKQIKEEMVNP